MIMWPFTIHSFFLFIFSIYLDSFTFSECSKWKSLSMELKVHRNLRRCNYTMTHGEPLAIVTNHVINQVSSTSHVRRSAGWRRMHEWFFVSFTRWSTATIKCATRVWIKYDSKTPTSDIRELVASRHGDSFSDQREKSCRSMWCRPHIIKNLEN